MSVTTTTGRESSLTERASFPHLFSWLDSLWPADLDVALRTAHGIRVEEFSRDGDFVVRAELPGFDVDHDINVWTANGILTIEAHREERSEEGQRSEFRYGRFRRSVMLPPGTDEGSVAAKYADGILEVTVRMPSEPEGRHDIKVARA